MMRKYLKIGKCSKFSKIETIYVLKWIFFSLDDNGSRHLVASSGTGSHN